MASVMQVVALFPYSSCRVILIAGYNPTSIGLLVDVDWTLDNGRKENIVAPMKHHVYRGDRHLKIQNVHVFYIAVRFNYKAILPLPCFVFTDISKTYVSGGFKPPKHPWQHWCHDALIKKTPLHCVVIVVYISRLARYDSTFFNQHLSTSFRGFIGQQVRLDFAWLCLERPFAHHAFPQGIYQQWRSFTASVEWETFARFQWKNTEVHRILIGWCFP